MPVKITKPEFIRVVHPWIEMSIDIDLLGEAVRFSFVEIRIVLINKGASK